MARRLDNLLSNIIDFDIDRELYKNDGEKITYSWMLGDVLVRSRTEDPVRAVELALKLKNQDSIIVDDSDMVMMENVIKQNQILNNLTIYRLLKFLESGTVI